jgi:hypothetical protein
VFATRLTRRAFMTRSAAAAAGLFLSSCFGERVSTAPRPRPSYGRIPRELDTRWPIKHVLYLMLENRSFDNLFGRFPGARGTGWACVGVVRCRWSAVRNGSRVTFPTTSARGRPRSTTGRWTGSRSGITAPTSPTRSSRRAMCRTTSAGRNDSCSATTSSRPLRDLRIRTTSSSSRGRPAGPSRTPRTS